MSVVRPVVASLVVILIVGACALLAAAPAEGHTDFIGADPHDGANLHEAPRDVRLEFSDAMDPGLSTVTVQVGNATSPPLEVTGGGQTTVLVAAIPSAMRPEDGTTTRWTVRFRVVSRDGHPVVGTTTFVVRAPKSATLSATPGASPTTQDPASRGSDPGSRAAADLEAPDQSGGGSAGGQPPWPLLAVGVGMLALLALAVGTVMRLVGRDPDSE